MFKRISNLIKGFFSMLIGGVEKANPEALLEVEKQNLREQIAKYNQGLASHAALSERLMSQVKKQSKSVTELRAKTTANLKAGNKSAAGQYAMRLRQTTSELDENRQQLEEAETIYKNLVRARDQSVTAAKAKIESLKSMITDMRVQQATAELTEMANGMISEIGGAGDTLNRLEEMVSDERNLAAGRARVARTGLDSELPDLNMAQAEQDALAEQALADFAAAEGIAIDAPDMPAVEKSVEEPEESRGKSMGPQAEAE